MARPPTSIKLSAKERQLLKENLRPKMEHRVVQRAKTILLAADGLGNDEISKQVGLSTISVCHWRRRYAKHGIVGLKDKSGRGRKRRLTHDQVLKVAEMACRPPAPSTHWSLRRLSKELGFVQKSRLQQLLKGFDIKPHQSRMWCFSTDPDFEKKKADVVGLYLHPPKNAFVICIDEKPCIQAISRQIRPVRPGSPEQRDHEYVRYGTVDLFAAFRTNDGKVIGKIEARHRGIEFLAFMKDVYRRWGRSGRNLHVVLDNLATHDVDEVRTWLGRHKNVEFHFTPSHASWLNQVELWFGILQRQALERGSFSGKEELSGKIMEFIEVYNRSSKSFAWCYGEPLKA
jgi:transposase